MRTERSVSRCTGKTWEQTGRKKTEGKEEIYWKRGAVVGTGGCKRKYARGRHALWPWATCAALDRTFTVHFQISPLLCPRFFSSTRSTALSRLIWSRIEDGLPPYLFPFIAILPRRDAITGFRRRRLRSRRPFHSSKTEFLREGSSPSSCVHTTMWRICCIYRAFHNLGIHFQGKKNIRYDVHRLAKVLERLWTTCMEMYTFHIQTNKLSLILAEHEFLLSLFKLSTSASFRRNRSLLHQEARRTTFGRFNCINRVIVNAN